MIFQSYKRRLVPRWRRANEMLLQPEAQAVVSSARRETEIDVARRESAIAKSIEEFQSEPSAGHLADALAWASFDPAGKMLRPIAEAALLRRDELPPIVSKIARSVLDGEELSESIFVPTGNEDEHDSEVRRRARVLRKLIYANPSDILSQMDLAQHHAWMGDNKAADRALTIARNLHPHSRLVLRTVARFYVHTDEPDRALKILRQSSRIESDPWLQASEIAISMVADESSRFAAKGRRVILGETFSPAHITELAGALGGIELQNGKVKEARKLFRRALIDPNDNVIAQVIHDRPYLEIGVDSPSIKRLMSPPYEGLALQLWNEGRIEEARDAAQKWCFDELFSGRPWRVVGLFSCLLGDFQRAINSLNIAHRLDPSNARILFSLAYAKACSGDPLAAHMLMRKISSAEMEPWYRIGALANYGCILFRADDEEQGKALYLEAISEFEKMGDKTHATACLAYLVRELHNANSPELEKYLIRARIEFEANPVVEAAVILRSIDEHFEYRLPNQPQRNAVQWVYDKQANVLVPQYRVSSKGAPRIIYKK